MIHENRLSDEWSIANMFELHNTLYQHPATKPNCAIICEHAVQGMSYFVVAKYQLLHSNTNESALNNIGK